MKKQLFSLLLTAILFTGILTSSAYAANTYEIQPVYLAAGAKLITPYNASEQVTATPSAVKFLVNGKSVSVDAYIIGGNNYIKLRDLAAMVNNTNKNFDVTWDGSNNTINLISNKAYTPVGGEMAKGDGMAKQAAFTSSRILVDGREVSLTAYTIGQNNYFKLRDVMQIFDIGVGWDGATSTAIINTNESYVPDDYGKNKPDAEGSAESGENYEISVLDNPSDNVMSIPDKIVYKVGDSFETTGFKIVCTGAGGKTVDITKDIELKIKNTTIYDGYQFTKPGYFIVDCYYKGIKINYFTVNVIKEIGTTLESGNYYMQINGKYVNPEGESAWVELTDQKPSKPFTVKFLMVDTNRGPLYSVMYGDECFEPSGSVQGAHLRVSISSGQFLWCIENYGDFYTVRKFSSKDMIITATDDGSEILVLSYPDTVPENAKITFIKAD